MSHPFARRARRNPLENAALWLTPREPGAVPRYLKPRNDVVFKMLLCEPEQHEFLVFLLNAVLRPSSPIVAATVQNPELPRGRALAKGAIVDVLVELADGSSVNVEMQNRPERSFRARVTGYLARRFAAAVRRGQGHEAAARQLAIVFLDHDEFDDEHVRHSVGLRDVETGASFLDTMQVELFELRKYRRREARGDRCERLSPHEALLLSFLGAVGEAEVDALAEEHPVMKQAARNLEKYSTVEDRRLLADLAEIRRVLRERDERLDREEAFREGEARGKVEGILEGEARGKAEGKREGILEGEARGKVEGKREGILEGEARGKVEGMLEGKLQAAVAMLARGVDRGVIEDALGLDLAAHGL